MNPVSQRTTADESRNHAVIQYGERCGACCSCFDCLEPAMERRERGRWFDCCGERCRDVEVQKKLEPCSVVLPEAVARDTSEVQEPKRSHAQRLWTWSSAKLAGLGCSPARSLVMARPPLISLLASPPCLCRPTAGATPLARAASTLASSRPSPRRRSAPSLRNSGASSSTGSAERSSQRVGEVRCFPITSARMVQDTDVAALRPFLEKLPFDRQAASQGSLWRSRRSQGCFNLGH
jgi:hypothetical protein